MRCSKVRKYIVDLHNGRLPAEKTQIILSHLRGCHACQNYYVMFQKTEHTLQMMSDYNQKIEEPFWLTERIIHAIEQSANSSQQRVLLPLPRIITLSTILAISITLFLGYIIFNRTKYYKQTSELQNAQVEELMIAEMTETYYTNFLAINTQHYANE